MAQPTCLLPSTLSGLAWLLWNKVEYGSIEPLVMVSHKFALEAWCEETWGQVPLEISEWASHDDVLQVFIKLNRGVLIADFAMDEDNKLQCEEHLHIPQDRWNPGSVQAHRTNEGRVRFRHRSSEIVLSARMRAPEWGQALLEEWLMEQRGEALKPKDRSQRLSSINRSKLSIERNLNQARLTHAQSELAIAQDRLNSAEVGLNSKHRSTEEE
jgi:hypothetical protein